MAEPLAKIGSLTGKKKFLLNFYGYNSIRGAKKDFNGTDKQIYDYLKDQYNDEIEKIKYEQRRVKRNAQAKAKRDMKKQQIKSKVFKLPENNLSNLRNALKNYIGKQVMVDYVIGKNIIRSKEYNVCLLYTSPSPRD